MSEPRGSQQAKRESFVLHPMAYYRVRAAYDRARLIGRPPASGTLSPGLRILSYHRIGSGDALCVEPEMFRRHLESAVDLGAVPISLADGIELLQRRQPIDRPYLAVTFDDGYLDNLENALPILESAGMPGTIFLVSAVADGRESFHWYRRNPPPAITWDVARANVGHPLIAFQAHGTHHKRLTALSTEDLREEMAGVKTEIERELGTTVTTFCYAAGLFGDREADMLAELGYRAATANTPGVNQPGGDLLRLKRIAVSWFDDARSLGLRLAGSVGESRLEHWIRARRRLPPLAPS
jgi:peptidoglycan/xylan/chitin deacetylase (PgdA/CDA1 family)